MTSTDSVRATRALRRAAVDRLASRGVDVPRGQFSRTECIAHAICAWMGWEPAADPLDTLREYLGLIDDTPPVATPAPAPYVGQVAPGRMVMPKERPTLQLSPAMRIAAERAVVQPRLHAMVSRVCNPMRDF